MASSSGWSKYCQENITDSTRLDFVANEILFIETFEVKGGVEIGIKHTEGYIRRRGKTENEALRKGINAIFHTRFLNGELNPMTI